MTARPRRPKTIYLHHANTFKAGAKWLKKVINPFVSNAPFLYPLKTSRNVTVFWCCQGVEKGCIGNEWVKDEKFHQYLNHDQFNWKFNLSRVPRWGGHFKQIIDFTKQNLYQWTGKSQLIFTDLEEVLIDVEINLNNGPLTYIKDD